MRVRVASVCVCVWCKLKKFQTMLVTRALSHTYSCVFRQKYTSTFVTAVWESNGKLRSANLSCVSVFDCVFFLFFTSIDLFWLTPCTKNDIVSASFCFKFCIHYKPLILAILETHLLLSATTFPLSLLSIVTFGVVLLALAKSISVVFTTWSNCYDSALVCGSEFWLYYA